MRRFSKSQTEQQPNAGATAGRRGCKPALIFCAFCHLTFACSLAINDVPMTQTKYISATPTIMSGDPVIVGTRVPISRILFLLKEGYTLEAIHEEYPHIPTETLAGAIDEVIAVIKQTLHAKKVSQV